MAAPKAVPSRARTARAPQRADKRPPASAQKFLERLPPEVLLGILSYLDASALFTISHVNKLLSRLASENALWRKIYASEFGEDEERAPGCVAEVAAVGARDRAAGYWRRLYFRTVGARDMDKWGKHLRHTSRHTGLPSQTERVLRNLRTTWELTAADASGREITRGLSWSQFSETSVTLCWSGGGFPSYQQISTLRLHGVRRVALNCPGLKRPGWRSLMAKLDMQTLTESAQVVGRDSLVELKQLQPGVVIGVWRGQLSSLAFVMFTLHFHRLVERSTQGSPVCPYSEPIFKPPFDDIDPEYGLHGYQLHIALHDTACEIMSGSFPQLFCRRTHICDGLIQLTAIRRTEACQRVPLSASVTLPWRCEALQGAVQNCCVMSLTLLEENGRPFWCVSSAVSMEPEAAPACYDCDGEHFLVHYQDSDGQVKMTLGLTEGEKRFFLLSLAVYVTVSKVNQHFSRDY